MLPESIDEVQRIVRHARAVGKGVRAAGAGHSPSDIACTGDFMLSLEKMNKLISVDDKSSVVTMQGGTWLYDLFRLLPTHGLQVSSMGSISNQSIAGMISTAAHGYGFNFACYSSMVTHLVLVLGDGTVARCSPTEDADLFRATLCGLGATGIIVEVGLQCEGDYRLEEETFGMEVDDYVKAIEGADGTPNSGIFASAEHVRTYYYPQVGKIRVQRANRTKRPLTPPPARHTALMDRVLGFVHQIGLFIGRYFPSYLQWHARLMWRIAESGPPLKSSKTRTTEDHPYPRNSRSMVTVGTPETIFTYDCGPRQYTFECAVKIDNLRACFTELRRWLESEQADPNGLRHHFPIEMRVSAPDDVWLSPAYHRRVVWIGIMQYKPFNFPVSYKRLFQRFEHVTCKHEGRPHWAKAHRANRADLEGIYERLPDYLAVRERVDPDGVFLNAYLRRHLFGELGEATDTNRWKWSSPYWKAMSV